MILFESVHQASVFFHNVIRDSFRFCFPSPMSAVKLFLVKNAHDVTHQVPAQPNKAIDKILHSSICSLLLPFAHLFINCSTSMHLLFDTASTFARPYISRNRFKYCFVCLLFMEMHSHITRPPFLRV